MFAGSAKSRRFMAASAASKSECSALKPNARCINSLDRAEIKYHTVNLSVWLVGRGNALLSRPASNHNRAPTYYGRTAASYLLYFVFFFSECRWFNRTGWWYYSPVYGAVYFPRDLRFVKVVCCKSMSEGKPRESRQRQRWRWMKRWNGKLAVQSVAQ